MTDLYRKLTQEEASVVLHNARIKMANFPSLRFGQAIHIVCYEGKYGQIEQALTGTHADLFHIEDSEKVGELFYRYWVESKDLVESNDSVEPKDLVESNDSVEPKDLVESNDSVEPKGLVGLECPEDHMHTKALKNLVDALDNAGVTDDNLTLPSVKKAIEEAKEILCVI